MVSSTVFICSEHDSELPDATHRNGVGRAAFEDCSRDLSGSIAHSCFLRIPPFPGARLSQFGEVRASVTHLDEGDLSSAADKLRELRVGGSYWAAEPELPSECVLIRSFSALDEAIRLADGRAIVIWDRDGQSVDCSPGVLIIRGECDPWHVLQCASTLIADSSDELLLIAALLEVACYEFDEAIRQAEPLTRNTYDLLADRLSGWSFDNPFTGAEMSALEAVELCGFWRRLIDSNREISHGVGFAFWKQSHIAPLLWGGADPLRFVRNGAASNSTSPIAIWRAKVGTETLSALEHANSQLIEVEDGFLRSRGLGADCVPPLSITVDRLAPHFDPSRASELELLLETGEFDDEMIARARELRRMIVDAGLGKYEKSDAVLDRPAGERRHILVPGQVEDDRAVQVGGCGLTSNLDLLKRVRDAAPDAYILYKPHPDVLAGHRRGAVPERLALESSDEVVGQLSIGALIDVVDEVHVNTSLTGFEALLRCKSVTTYGVPFYAGWGLTRDLGPIPSRRTRVRTLDELVAATLLIYPRYFDPVTGLPCPAEIAVARLTMPEARDPGIVVSMRRLQGKFMRRLRSLVQ